MSVLIPESSRAGPATLSMTIRVSSHPSKLMSASLRRSDMCLTYSLRTASSARSPAASAPSYADSTFHRSGLTKTSFLQSLSIGISLSLSVSNSEQYVLTEPTSSLNDGFSATYPMPTRYLYSESREAASEFSFSRSPAVAPHHISPQSLKS